MGKILKEKVDCDMMVENVMDFRNGVVRLCYNKDYVGFVLIFKWCGYDIYGIFFMRLKVSVRWIIINFMKFAGGIKCMFYKFC